jgi:formylglycine-generating enzyme required for sulfatase activity
MGHGENGGNPWIQKNNSKHLWHVMYGGSWHSKPGECRSAHRCSDNIATRDGSLGFRVVYGPTKTF